LRNIFFSVGDFCLYLLDLGFAIAGFAAGSINFDFSAGLGLSAAKAEIGVKSNEATASINLAAGRLFMSRNLCTKTPRTH
jgi:hypothetical protein